jgi:hypothetical protein
MRLAASFNIGDIYQLKEGVGIGSRYGSLGSLGQIVSVLLPNAFILAGVILLFLLIGGGLMVIINAGGNNPENVAKGQKAITAAVLGFLIVFTSYWVVQIVEYVTGLDILQ